MLFQRSLLFITCIHRSHQSIHHIFSTLLLNNRRGDTGNMNFQWDDFNSNAKAFSDKEWGGGQKSKEDDFLLDTPESRHGAGGGGNDVWQEPAPVPIVPSEVRIAVCGLSCCP